MQRQLIRILIKENIENILVYLKFWSIVYLPKIDQIIFMIQVSISPKEDLNWLAYLSVFTKEFWIVIVATTIVLSFSLFFVVKVEAWRSRQSVTWVPIETETRPRRDWDETETRLRWDWDET